MATTSTTDPMMPYTWGLLRSIPRLGHVSERLEPISGSPPSMIFLPKGCSFNPRCPYVFDTCTSRSRAAAGRRSPRRGVPPASRTVSGSSRSRSSPHERDRSDATPQAPNEPASRFFA